MKNRKAQLVGEQLRQALEVLFMNLSPATHRDMVKVTFLGTRFAACRDFTFKVQASDLALWDTRKFEQEIEKILPNVRVTESLVLFSTRNIRLTCKELGKRGTYRFEFLQVRA